MNKINKNYPYYISDFCNSLLFTFLNELWNNKLWIEQKKIVYKFDSSMILFLIIIPIIKLLSTFFIIFVLIFILLFVLKFSLPRLSEILFLKLII